MGDGIIQEVTGWKKRPWKLRDETEDVALSMEGIDKRQHGEKMENSTSNEVVVDILDWPQGDQ